LSVSIQGSLTRQTSFAVASGIEVQSGDPPDVSLVSPASTYPNVNQAMSIEAHVYSCCRLADFACKEYKAEWYGVGLSGDAIETKLSDIITEQPSMFLNNPSVVADTESLTGYRMYKIIVAGNQLSPGSQYSFKLKVTDACGTSTSTLPTIQMNSPPSGGSMEVEGVENSSPTSGWSLTSASATKFVLSAPGWSDPEAKVGLDSPLTYTFVYLKDPTDETSKLVRLFTGVEISTYSTQLPAGHGDNGLFKLAVIIEDEDGGKTRSSFTSIYVQEEPLPVESAAQEAIFDNLISSNLESAQNRSQSQEVMAAANMVGAALTSGNVDPEVQTRIASQLMEMAFSASETMATDTDSVDMQAQFLDTIATSTSLDPAAEDQALSMVESLSSAAEGNGEISPDTVSALANTLNAFMLTSNAANSASPSDGGNFGGSGGTTVAPTGGSGATPPRAPPVVVDVEKVQRMQRMVENLASAIASSLTSGAKPVAIKTATFTATLESARPSAMVASPIQSESGKKC
jgi:hypothetical protein